ncbi:MAG: class I SAM-dependent methyltransferase [Candidatus Melainabacteria bacterium]
MPDVVAEQYEQWVYPLPIEDLEEFCKDGKADGSAVFLNHWLYWPDGWYERQNGDIDILIAGCGANAAARFAYQHPNARVTGIDLSEASLNHERYLKEKHNLDNLTLHQMRLEDVGQLNQTFDFIDSVGVLHHLPDPKVGLDALKSVLRPHGVITIMLYATYGRAGLYLLQGLFTGILGLDQSPEDVALVKDTLNILAPRHLGQTYFSDNLDLGYDAGVVDLFLHKIDRPYTVGDCLDFLDTSGLAFQGWLDNYNYYPDGQIPASHPLFPRITALPEPVQWQAMELFHGSIAQHNFYASHPERDPATYAVDFESRDFLNVIPHRRHLQVIQPNAQTGAPPMIQRPPFPAIPLNIRQSLIYNVMDGKRTVGQIVRECGIEDQRHAIEQSVRAFLKALWRIGYVMFQLPQIP